MTKTQNGPAWRAMIEAFPDEQRHLYLHQEHCYSISDHDRPHIDVASMAPMTFTGTAGELRARATELESAGLTDLLYLPCGPDVIGEIERMADALS